MAQQTTPLAYLIAIGDELNDGRQVNTNSTHIAKLLKKAKIHVQHTHTVGDNPELIKVAINSFLTSPPVHPLGGHTKIIAIAKENVLIITGGLGATEDDRTVEAVATALDRKIVTDAKQLRRLQAIQKKHALPNAFLSQAKRPDGFIAKTNPWGSAPFLYRLTKKPYQAIFLLPGVPTECLSLCENYVLPLIKKHFPQTNHPQLSVEASFRAIGISESITEAIIQTLDLPQELRYAFLPQAGELLVIIKDLMANAPRAEREQRVSSAQKKILATLGRPQTKCLCYAGASPLIEKIHQEFIARKWKLAVAESCTGGLMADRFIAQRGSSAYFMGALVTYANSFKTGLLGVRETTLKKYGAVSPQCANEMAQGMAQHLTKLTKLTKRKPTPHATISITGLAGPDGETANKSTSTSTSTSTGTVFIGLHISTHKGAPPRSEVLHLNLIGNRQSIRTQSVQRATIGLAKFLHQHAGFFNTAKKIS